MWENISMKNNVGMCLWNQETKTIDFHNEALDLLMGSTKLGATRTKIENTILKPKKRKINMATKQTLEMVYKEVDFQQEAIIIDKRPQTLKQVIMEMVRCCKIADESKQP